MAGVLGTALRVPNAAEPLVSYWTNRQLSGWIPPPLMIRALVAHCQLRTLCLVEARHLNSVAYLRAISFI
jgi:hypothetical protein